MNYQKIYNQIIERAKNENRTKNKEIYYEAHHIIPVCLGGEGKKNQTNHANLVLLTAKEHFLCHRLLVEIYPNHKGIIYSFWMMSNGCYTKSDNHHRYIPSSRAYKHAKELFIRNKIGVKQSKETIEKRIKKSKGQKRSKETCRLISQSKMGKLPPVAGKKYSEESKEKQRQAKLGAFKQGKSIIQYDLEGNFIKEWSSITEAGNNLGICLGNISCVLKNKQKSAKGFKFKYKD